MFTGFPEETLRFFLDIRFHNQINYFEEHRQDYIRDVQTPFYAFISELAPRMQRIDPQMEIRPHKCLARIRRDTRFTKDKSPYRDYHWGPDIKREILKAFTLSICSIDAKIINVIIDKTRFVNDQYKVLENALKYNIQRIENDSKGEWNYIIITDKGRIVPMRKTARAIRAYNPIASKYLYQFKNQPVTGLIEDILEKDSKESYFIQICDFVSYFVNLYYKVIRGKSLPNRSKNIIDESFVKSVMKTLKVAEKLNLKANPSNAYGLVIYPK